MKIRRFIGLNKIYFLVELTYQMKEENTHDSGRCGEKYEDFHTSAGEKQRCLFYNQITNSEVLK